MLDCSTEEPCANRASEGGEPGQLTHPAAETAALNGRMQLHAITEDGPVSSAAEPAAAGRRQPGASSADRQQPGVAAGSDRAAEPVQGAAVQAQAQPQDRESSRPPPSPRSRRPGEQQLRWQQQPQVPQPSSHQRCCRDLPNGSSALPNGNHLPAAVRLPDGAVQASAAAPAEADPLQHLPPFKRALLRGSRQPTGEHPVPST